MEIYLFLFYFNNFRSFWLIFFLSPAISLFKLAVGLAADIHKSTHSHSCLHYISAWPISCHPLFLILPHFGPPFGPNFSPHLPLHPRYHPLPLLPAPLWSHRQLNIHPLPLPPSPSLPFLLTTGTDHFVTLWSIHSFPPTPSILWHFFLQL